MKVSLSILKQSLKLWSFVLVVAITMLVPFSAFSQEEQQDELEINSGSNSQDQQIERTVPVVGGNPWENSAGSTIGTPSADNGTSGSSVSANPSSSRPGAAQRPIGSTIDGRDPPGNPDVPFDKNMNLLFLLTGVIFAFWIAKKRLSSKTAN